MIVNNHYQIIDTKHGQMIVNMHDMGISKSLLVHGSWAMQEIGLTLPYAKGIVCDVGANIGTHTLSYAATATHIYAFEPQPFMFDMLCTNLLLNSIRNVTPVQCALGPTTCTTHMNIHDPTERNSPAGERVGKGESTVSMHTLDSLAIGHIDFIKMDIEGFELEALKGMTETLSLYHPTLYIEIHYAELIEQIADFLAHFDYKSVPLIATHVIYPDGKPFIGAMEMVYGFLYQADSGPTLVNDGASVEQLLEDI